MTDTEAKRLATLKAFYQNWRGYAADDGDGFAHAFVKQFPNIVLAPLQERAESATGLSEAESSYIGEVNALIDENVRNPIPPEYVRTLLAIIDRLSTSPTPGGWRPIVEAARDGTPMLASRTVRYLPYKPDGKRQMRADGRWQEWNGHGWTNCTDDPESFMPAPPPAQAVADGETRG